MLFICIKRTVTGFYFPSQNTCLLLSVRLFEKGFTGTMFLISYMPFILIDVVVQIVKKNIIIHVYVRYVLDEARAHIPLAPAPCTCIYIECHGPLEYVWLVFCVNVFKRLLIFFINSRRNIVYKIQKMSTKQNTQLSWQSLTVVNLIFLVTRHEMYS